MPPFTRLPRMPQSPSPTPALKRIALRAGIGLSLGIAALAAGHLMPQETPAPARTIALADAPAFDFGPQLPPKAQAAAEAPKLAVATAEPAAPLPTARPRVVSSSPSRWSTVAGVERYDRCTSTCESRDPALTGAKTAAVVLASAPASSPAPQAVAAPQKPMLLGWVDDGRRMVSGAIDTTAAAVSTVQAAVLGAITPEH